jgi:hypothetical protein
VAPNPIADDAKRVEIDVRGGITWVRRAEVISLLEDTLSNDEQYWGFKDGRLAKQDPEIAEWFFREAGREICFPTGLLARACAALSHHGYQAIVRGDPVPPGWNRRVHKFIEKYSLGASDTSLVKAAGQRGGQLVVESDAQAWRSMGMLLDLFRKEHCLVVVRNQAQVQIVLKQLRSFLERNIFGASNLGLVWKQPAHALVLDFQQFGAWISDPAQWDVILFAEARLALGDRAAQSLVAMLDTKRFCIIRDHEEFIDAEGLAIEAYFGPPLWRQADWKQTDAIVEVHISETPVIAVGDLSDPFERKRALIWHNDRRNRQVSEIAQAFQRRDIRTLHRFGLLLDESPQWFDQFPGGLSVAVVAEVPEHARCIGEFLPDWPIRTAHDRELEFPAPKHLISTLLYACDRGPLNFNVIVRADGSATPWEPRWGPARSCDERPLLLVDFDDLHDEHTTAAARGRLQHYKELGWTNYQATEKPAAQSL